jgi:aminoglycoside phosphotransferase family enzyme/predicted kinase
MTTGRAHRASDQKAVFDMLGEPATHGIQGPVKRIDTHAAAVFLAGQDVYKVKKAVRFPFMDQSTLELRRRACEAEVAVNRHFTPELYLGVVPIVRENDQLRLDGAGEPVEWAVHLKRFDETKTLDLVAERGEITSDMVLKIAALITESHRVAVVGEGTLATEALAGVIEETLTELLEAPNIFPHGETTALAAAMRSAFSVVRGLLLDRGAKGRVRRCHGDLHLRNIALLGRGPALFDAIEFSESIATTDVLYDLAFVLMDLWERGFRAEANLLLNRYLWICVDIAVELAGLAALPLFMSLRAAVLAKVAAIRFRDVDQARRTRAEALRYFAVAGDLLRPARPILVAVGGLSGSGKTTLSARVAPSIGKAPGAVHLRSDIERKRVFGVEELTFLPPPAYAKNVTDRVFANLREMAETALRAGYCVVVDAVHRTAEERALLRAVADRVGVRFVGLWLDAPLELLARRVVARTGDASDATADVVKAQSGEATSAIEWRRLDAALPPETLVARALAAIGWSPTGAA